jgi:hypothetical protein
MAVTCAHMQRLQCSLLFGAIFAPFAPFGGSQLKIARLGRSPKRYSLPVDEPAKFIKEQFLLGQFTAGRLILCSCVFGTPVHGELTTSGTVRVLHLVQLSIRIIKFNVS